MYWKKWSQRLDDIHYFTFNSRLYPRKHSTSLTNSSAAFKYNLSFTNPPQFKCYKVLATPFILDLNSFEIFQLQTSSMYFYICANHSSQPHCASLEPLNSWLNVRNLQYFGYCESFIPFNVILFFSFLIVAQNRKASRTKHTGTLH